jgi:hypothetical protein
VHFNIRAFVGPLNGGMNGFALCLDFGNRRRGSERHLAVVE